MGLVSLLFSSCYLLRQGSTLVGFQLKAEPIDRLTDTMVYRNGEPVSETTAAFLDEVEHIRAFASSELGLDTSRNYTSFVPTDRETLAYVVNATGELSFERKLWRWPLAGSFPYKGFFRDRDAVRLADRLRRSGHDVWVRRVDAFSTLGILRDPLYQFMESYDRYDLANMIIHEQTHATLFLRNQVQFNEGLATFVGDVGARAYLQFAGASPDELTRIDDVERDRATIREVLADLRSELTAVYESDMDIDTMRAEKQRVIDSVLQHLRDNYDTLFRTDLYRSIPDLPVNNAFIDLFSAYTQDLSVFEELYAACGSSLKAMFDSLSILAEPRRIADREERKLARTDPVSFVRTVLLDEARGRQ